MIESADGLGGGQSPSGAPASPPSPPSWLVEVIRQRAPPDLPGRARGVTEQTPHGGSDSPGPWSAS
ncbi:hypothetical protein THAOC_11957, partial [Thalassiosira oceanica]